MLTLYRSCAARIASSFALSSARGFAYLTAALIFAVSFSARTAEAITIDSVSQSSFSAVLLDSFSGDPQDLDTASDFNSTPPVDTSLVATATASSFNGDGTATAEQTLSTFTLAGASLDINLSLDQDIFLSVFNHGGAEASSEFYLDFTVAVPTDYNFSGTVSGFFTDYYVGLYDSGSNPLEYVDSGSSSNTGQLAPGAYRIEVYASMNVSGTFFEETSNASLNLSLSPVPEPAGWMIALPAVMVLGFAGYRSRCRKTAR